ncbi:protein of unknown function [Paraburkholderia kururiensis]
MGQQGGGATRRRPPIKEMLLPLRAGLARDLSIENHLALAAMGGGHGTQDTLVSLMRVGVHDVPHAQRRGAA